MAEQVADSMATFGQVMDGEITDAFTRLGERWNSIFAAKAAELAQARTAAQLQAAVGHLGTLPDWARERTATAAPLPERERLTFSLSQADAVQWRAEGQAAAGLMQQLWQRYQTLGLTQPMLVLTEAGERAMLFSPEAGPLMIAASSALAAPDPTMTAAATRERLRATPAAERETDAAMAGGEPEAATAGPTSTARPALEGTLLTRTYGIAYQMSALESRTWSIGGSRTQATQALIDTRLADAQVLGPIPVLHADGRALYHHGGLSPLKTLVAVVAEAARGLRQDEAAGEVAPARTARLTSAEELAQLHSRLDTLTPAEPLTRSHDQGLAQ